MSPKIVSSKTTLDKFLTVLTTCQNVCRRSRESTLKVRIKQQNNLFKTIRFSQEIPWTHSKQIWLPCQKVFPRSFNFIVKYCSFLQIFLLVKSVILARKMQFTNRVEKLSRTSDVFSGSISKVTIKFKKEDHVSKCSSGIIECWSDNTTRNSAKGPISLLNV